MSGAHIERLAHRIVRDETYDLIVAPAIADLHFEAPLGRFARLRAVVAVWLAIAGGLREEVRQDFAQTCTPPVLARASGAGLFTIALQAMLFMWMWSFNPYEHPTAFVLLLPALVSGALPAAMLPAAAILARTNARGAGRVVAIAGTALAALLLVAADRGITETNQKFREEMFVANGLPGAPARGAQERTLAELLVRDDRDSRVAMHHRLSFVGLTVAWTLLGLAVARAPGSAICGTALLGYGFLLLSPFLGSPELAARLPAWSPWIPVALIAATSQVAGVYARRAGWQAGPEP
jgi:hypothetical protein